MINSVLVLEGELASTLAIVRSLGRKGCRIDVGGSAVTMLAAKSRYCSDHFVYPDPLRDVSGFHKTLLKRIETHSYKLLVPVTGRTIRPLLDLRGMIERSSLLLAMPSKLQLAAMASRESTFELARRLSVPMAKTVTVRTLADFKEEFAYPLILRRESANGGRDDDAVFVTRRRELEEELPRLLDSSGAIVAQEYIKGNSIGIGLLAHGGATLCTFQYRRLHDVPVTGGASSYCVSEVPDKSLVEYASSLIRALNWDGMAHADFKVDGSTRKAYLTDIVGGFWDSLPLAVAAGADFPAYLLDLIMRGRTEFPRDYKVGLRRRLLSSELEWFRDILAKRANPELRPHVPSKWSLLADASRMIRPKESAALDWSDPLPALAELSSLGAQIGRYARRKFWLRLERRRMCRIQNSPRNLIDRLRRAKNILIVCQGNIIRSPFAAGLLREVLKPIRPVCVHSAGLEAVPGSPAHARTVSKAKCLGLDLSRYCSVPLTQELVVEADIVFAMELVHLRVLCERYPSIHRKTFLLGCLSAESGLEIPDPIFKHEVAFNECFDQIAKSVTAVAPLSRASENSDSQVPVNSDDAAFSRH